MSTMTLEQASFRIRELSSCAYAVAKRTLGNELGRIADAIDAHITSREAKPVAWMRLENDPMFSEPQVLLTIRPEDHEPGSLTPLYTHPAAQQAADHVEQPRGADIWFEDANDRDAWRYRRLRSAPVGVPGVPCIAIPSSSTNGAYVNGDHADAAVDEAKMPKDDAVVAYIETMPNGNQGLVWADHPANTVGHIFTPLVIGGEPKPEQAVGDCEHPLAHGNPKNAYTFICDTCGKEIV